ncbi:hypothetical protein GCM10010246_13350 [Streptomyces cuspidosporus]|uniref:Uncharacterized protein n=1 Tax=Streptomyces cuspidosporus TaxID=66882 RepID=A0ABN3FJT3_9ACTN
MSERALGPRRPWWAALMLMAKSRHKKPENVRRYFKPSPEAIAELTSLLAPGDATRTRGDVVTVPGNCQ